MRTQHQVLFQDSHKLPKTRRTAFCDLGRPMTVHRNKNFSNDPFLSPPSGSVKSQEMIKLLPVRNYQTRCPRTVPHRISEVLLGHFKWKEILPQDSKMTCIFREMFPEFQDNFGCFQILICLSSPRPPPSPSTREELPCPCPAHFP